ncbi:MAG: tRNA pseudouridine(55) synthase TruB [Puniceicoccales bacterium]|jgi:tRNA pseudouridine55 synthase|nr:tRNA pseudouridine(55) synthase TruB [Puniceicoccales bacterium]
MELDTSGNRHGNGGILLVDKPLGLTSADVVSRLRRKLPGVKVGHGGTLDPMATGLLIVMLNGATKLSDKLMAGRKVYTGTIYFGFSTDGDDREGRPLSFGHCSAIGLEKIERTLPQFVGQFWQRPPALCAAKIGGVAAYKLVRRGKKVPEIRKLVDVHSIDSLGWSAPLLKIRISCSMGTYIRSIGRDIGEKLRCPAHLHELRRMSSGNFSLQSARRLSLLEALPPEEIWTHCIAVSDCGEMAI